jgi:serine/threonine protein kinase
MSSDPRIGTTLAGFAIESLIGRGGMSVVYRARQERPARYVALKLLAPELSNDDAFRKRFERESDAAAAIDHPNVVPVFATGEADATLFIAMRLVDGVDLGELIRREGPLPPARLVEIVEQVASALDAAHAMGLVHRDVKPGNILVVPQADTGARDHAYLTDFGLITRHDAVSGLTKTGQFMGSVGYVAPEQVRGDAVDARADVYSLGCVLYECLTGEQPFPRDNEASVLWGHMQDAPPLVSAAAPGLGSASDGVVSRAMAKDPADRFASCGDLARAARDALAASFSASATTGSSIIVAEETRGRSPALLFGLVAGIVAVAIAIVLVTSLSRDEGGDRGGAAVGTSSSPQPALELQPNTLVGIDPDTLQPIKSIPVGEQPTSVVVEGSIAWTANAGEKTITWVDLNDTSKTDAIPVDLGGGLSIVGDGADGVWAFEGDHRTIQHISGTRKVDRTIRIPAAVNWLVFMADGSAWETTGLFEDTYAIRFNPKNGKELARVEVGRFPTLVREGLGSLWVLAYEGQELDRIDPEAATMATPPIPIPTAPTGLAVGDADVWVGTSTLSKVFHVDPVHGTVDGDIGTGRSTHALVAQGNDVWVANQDQTVDLIDATTEEVIGSVDLGLLPTGGAVGDDGTFWVTVVEP